MRKMFIECRSYRTARKRAPWAAVIARCCGGFYAFESVTDYQQWRSN